MTAARVLGLFAKEPRPGQVKTRLADRTAPEWAARLADAFLRDFADRLATLDARRFLVYTPAESEPYFAQVASGRYELKPQAAGDLGERLAAFTREQLDGGARSVVLLGMDSPTVPNELIDRAFRELDHADVVLGPAVDGGYYLVGCSGRLPPIFEGITWGSQRVLAETVARLYDPAWRLALLPPWYDVDFLLDVQVLRGHLAALRRAGTDPELPRTRELLSLPIPNEFPMYVSVLLTSLPLPFEEAVARVAALGFTHVDVIALAERPEGHREALADSGLLVSCASVGRALRAGETLDAADRALRQAAVETIERQIADAAQLGATCCYLVPGLDASTEALTRFADACTLLADYAARRMVRLCVEPIPGRALSSAAATGKWLRGVDHPNLKLLLDVGHCLISNEDPFATILGLGHVGYVHLDDNDGVGDLHWPLLTGKLTDKTLRRTLDALATEDYKGGVALELNPENPDPETGLRAGKALIERILLEDY